MKRCDRVFTLAVLTMAACFVQADDLPAVKLLASFEDKNPFDGATVVAEHATDGQKALRIDAGYASMDGPQNWSGYDFLKADLFSAAHDPQQIYIEIRDTASKDYWTRVNYQTVIPPGQSTLILTLSSLYIGEKSRPGRKLDLPNVTRLVFSVGDKPQGAVFLDNLRLERDDAAKKAAFDGLHAFSLGPADSPVIEGFTRISPATVYEKSRGYGLLNAHVWKTFNALQPDPLYENFICIESGGLAVDVPNGSYHVVVNCDSPSGFWGEYQVYTERSILAEGKEVSRDTFDFTSFKKKYYRFWDVEDSPADNTFDKYQKEYFHEKAFDVDVADGQLNLDFKGSIWANSVSAVIIYPNEKAAQGEQFLKFVEARRRFHFDNYFKRVLHPPSGDPLTPAAADTARGYVVFVRDFMKEVFYNDTPFKAEIDQPLTGDAFAGQYQPLTVAIAPLKDLGKVTATVGALSGPGGKIPPSAIDVAFVSYRVTRVTSEGTVYTITPRLLMPRPSVDVKKDVTRRFWLTVRTPADAKPGVYTGELTLNAEHGARTKIPISFRVRAGTLDAVDIPVGPWGHTIDIPWQGAEAQTWNAEMALKSLQRLREYGFTMFSGLPYVEYSGFKDGQPVLNFTTADAQMIRAREAGFSMPVVSYCGFGGLDLYKQT